MRIIILLITSVNVGKSRLADCGGSVFIRGRLGMKFVGVIGEEIVVQGTTDTQKQFSVNMSLGENVVHIGALA